MTYRYAELAARVLVRANVRQPPRLLATRAATVASLEAALEARAGRARRRLWFLRIAAVSAAAVTTIAAYGLVRHPPSREASTAKGPSPSALSAPLGILAHPSGAGALGGMNDGAPLGPGSRIATNPEGRVDLTFSTGTHLFVEERAELVIVEGAAAQVFRLERGSVQAQVAKLRDGERFVVRTPDAEVEVRGTSFRVAVVAPDPACEASTRTRIQVGSGQVAVRTAAQETVLGPGETWPKNCPPEHRSEIDPSRVARTPFASAPPSSGTAANGPNLEPHHPGTAANGPNLEPHRPALAANRTDVEDPRSDTEPTRRVAAVDSPNRTTEPTLTKSALAEINDRFAEAMTAKRQGRAAQAIDLFEQLQSRFPSSPLAESAMVEEVRLLKVTDPARAAVLADRYLSRYPKGFARPEAEALRGQRK